MSIVRVCINSWKYSQELSRDGRIMGKSYLCSLYFSMFFQFSSMYMQALYTRKIILTLFFKEICFIEISKHVMTDRHSRNGPSLLLTWFAYTLPALAFILPCVLTKVICGFCVAMGCLITLVVCHMFVSVPELDYNLLREGQNHVERKSQLGCAPPKTWGENLSQPPPGFWWHPASLGLKPHGSPLCLRLHIAFSSLIRIQGDYFF